MKVNLKTHMIIELALLLMSKNIKMQYIHFYIFKLNKHLHIYINYIRDLIYSPEKNLNNSECFTKSFNEREVDLKRGLFAFRNCVLSNVLSE